MTATYEGILGQERALSALRGCLSSGRPAAAYLFTGPDGVGKKRSALAFAAAMNCRDAGTDACGVCPSCHKVGRNVHPDVTLWQRPRDRKSFPIDMVRELIASLGMTPFQGRRKVAVIDEADAMTEEAANALLLTLEEPSPSSCIILLAAAPRNLPETIRSRCQTVYFRPLADDVVADIAVAAGTDPGDAALLAMLAEGSPAAALSLGEGKWRERLEEAAGVLALALRDVSLGLCHPAVVKCRTRDEADRLLGALQIVLRVLWRRSLDLSVPELPAGVAGHFGGAPPPGRHLVRLLEDLHRSRELMARINANPRLTVERFIAGLAALPEAPG